jgi:ERCC4-type nuclease
VKELHSSASLIKQSTPRSHNRHLGTIIIDSREFRAALLASACKAFRLIPATLSIGDYLLSDNHCVERKGYEDLVSSMKTGRLFRQCFAMVNSFSKPLLLLEVCSCSGNSVLFTYVFAISNILSMHCAEPIQMRCVD